MKRASVVVAVICSLHMAACSRDSSTPPPSGAEGGGIGADAPAESREDASTGIDSGGGGSSGGEGVGGRDSGLGPIDARSEEGHSLNGDASDDAIGLPARVLLYHFSTLEIPSVPAQLAFFKSKL